MPAWKHKSAWMPSYTPDNKELNAYLWCVRNNIRISPQAILGNKKQYKIAISTGGDLKLSPPYTVDIIWSKLYEFCIYYQSKYENSK